MPCDIDTVKSSACESGIGKVQSEIQLLQIIAQSASDWLLTVDAGADVSVDAIKERACESGIGKVEDEYQLLRIIAQNLCSMVT